MYSEPMTRSEPETEPARVHAWFARLVYPGPEGTRFAAAQVKLTCRNSFSINAEKP